jgi:nucleoside-triphosphatase THEP1
MLKVKWHNFIVPQGLRSNMKILLTAPPGLGKSTVVDSVVRDYPGSKCGVVAREILDAEGKRVGFTSVNGAGLSKQFMYIANVIGSGSIAGLFDVDLNAIDTFVVSELRQGLQNPYALIYVDEIGRAQAQSVAFLSAVQELIQSDRNVIGTIVYDKEPWSLKFRQGPALSVIEVTLANRNALPGIILAAFESDQLFRALTDSQQRTALALLQQLLVLEQHEAARKLFNNAVPYVTQEKVRLLSRRDTNSVWQVSGNTNRHMVVQKHDDDSFTCDCHLHNGTGPYLGQAQICSHQLSVLITSAQ